MIHSLPLFHRIRGTKVLVLGDGDAAQPKRRLVERAGGLVENDMQRAIDEGVRIAFIAYEDSRACENAAINLRCAGMLVNVVDMPELCDFTTPSILDRNPVLVAVSTGGASAGLAKHLRLRLEQILPQSLGSLANALFAARDRLRTKYPEAANRRRVLDEALEQGGALDPFSASATDVEVDTWLEGSMPYRDGRTEIVHITSADPEELTLRHARLLGEADTILLKGNVPDQILARARADARRIPWSSEAAKERRTGLTVIAEVGSV